MYRINDRLDGPDDCYSDDLSFQDVRQMQEDLKYAQHFFEAVVEELFSDEVRLEKLESHLEELGSYLDVKIPRKPLKITKDVA